MSPACIELHSHVEAPPPRCLAVIVDSQTLSGEIAAVSKLLLQRDLRGGKTSCNSHRRPPAAPLFPPLLLWQSPRLAPRGGQATATTLFYFIFFARHPHSRDPRWLSGRGEASPLNSCLSSPALRSGLAVCLPPHRLFFYSACRSE